MATEGTAGYVVPRCLACGASIFTTRDVFYDIQNVTLNAAALEKAECKMAKRWTGHARMFMYDRKTGRRWMSGIVAMPTSDYPIIPHNTNAFINRSPDFPSGTPIFRPYCIFRWNFPHERGVIYGVHFYCWTMIKQVIGPDAEKHLGVLRAALFYNGLKELFNLEGFIEEAERIPNRQREALVRGHSTEPIILWNPLNNPAVGTLIRTARRRASEDTTEPITEAAARLSALPLPSEILERVLDHLDCEDILRFSKHFELRVPRSYWYLRTPRKLIFEAAEYGPDDLDWEYLCLGVEKLMLTDHCMRNRVRIFGILENVKPIFMEKLKENM